MKAKKKGRSFPSTIKWALINCVASIGMIYCFQFFNVDLVSSVKYLIYLPFVIFLLLMQNERKKLQGGYISYGEAFSPGFSYSFFTGILVAVFVYFYISTLNPKVVEQFMAIARQRLEQKNKFSPDQLNETMGMIGRYFSIIFTILVFVSFPFFGLIGSMISASVIKEEQPSFDVHANKAESS